MWCLIVSIPDLCNLTYFVHFLAQEMNTMDLIFTSLPCQFQDINSPDILIDPDVIANTLKVASVAVRSKAVVLLLMTFCLLLLPLWESVIVLCFVVRFFMSILVLQSS